MKGLLREEAISKEVLSAILQTIDEGIHAVNLEGVTIFYNEIAAEHDGLGISEVVGKSILELYPSLTRQTSTLLKVMKTKEPIYNQPQSYVNLHGKKIETINTTLPIIIDGELVGAVEIAKDYSRLKMLSERLLDLQQKIQSRKKKQKASSKQHVSRFADLKTKNLDFQQTIKDGEKLAKSDSAMLIYGESGTGKELFVQGVHQASRRAHGPLVAQNCAAIPESLLESMLFGTSKGSFTGALDRAGLFELADGGTLFLDEIHAMPIDLQAKLLRILEDGIIRRVGSNTMKRVDVRVIAAMNISPLEAMKRNQLRADLYYRLNVLMFELPPLRKRQEDIPFLTDYFISYFNEKLFKQVKEVDAEVRSLFQIYTWPGNVRELKHTMEYMMNICDSTILTRKDLPASLKTLDNEDKGKRQMENATLRQKLERYERDLIESAMVKSEYNIQKAAGLLGIPRQTLQYKLKKRTAEK